MASPCDNRLSVNIKNLPIVTDINRGDFLIVETPDGTNILDFRNFLVTLDNTTFSTTFINYNTQITEISAKMLQDYQEFSLDISNNTNSIAEAELSISNLINDVAALSAVTTSNATALPGNANIRISLDQNSPTPKSNIRDGSTLYIHPYKGNEISLYDTVEKVWRRHVIKNKIAQNLVDANDISLPAETNYDVFLENTEGTFIVTFDPWSNSTVNSDGAKNRTYIDGVCVHTGDYSKRLIGCLRTTIQGASEQTFGGHAAGGYGCKQLVWNAQNQIPVSCWSFESSQYNITASPDGLSYWRKVNSSIEYGYDGFNHRFSFITGDYNNISFTGQIFSTKYSGIMVIASVGIAIDTDQDVPAKDEGMLISQFRSDEENNQASPCTHLSKSFDIGFHTIQLLEKVQTWPSGNTIAMNMNNASNQTGYIVSLNM